MSDARRYDTGDTLKAASGREFEITGVSYQETDGKRHGFSYTIRDKEEMEAERLAEEKRQAEAQAALDAQNEEAAE